MESWDMDKRINELLSRKWALLTRKNVKAIGNSYPGVYILAYTEKDIKDQVPALHDVYYIGMSNAKAGLQSRLNQFMDGIEKGKGHSAGNRFFKKINNGIPYSGSSKKEKLYFCALTIETNGYKETRTPEDLRMMGEICRLEYYLMAKFKSQFGSKTLSEVNNYGEPELNKK